MARLRLRLSRNVKHHSLLIRILTLSCETRQRTVPAGQFDWGGFLPNCNGGARSSVQHGLQPCVEGMARSRVDCETNKSSRCESRPK